MHAYCHRVSFPQGRRGWKRGQFVPGRRLKRPPKGNFREWKRPPKTPKRVFCPGLPKSSGRSWLSCALSQFINEHQFLLGLRWTGVRLVISRVMYHTQEVYIMVLNTIAETFGASSQCLCSFIHS
jgi:hypothetical protein